MTTSEFVGIASDEDLLGFIKAGRPADDPANHRSNTFAQPGKKVGVSNGMSAYGAINTSQFFDAVRADGWKDSCDAYRNLSAVAVFMPFSDGNPFNDYHWYRTVTSNGIWGHKAGKSPASSTDSSNRQITWPLSCDRKFWFNNTWYPGYTLTSTMWYF
ncbi:MAG: hypothetical protein GY759_09935 [Chloroflexi bacterium]|nr:hypothetical protein [Chloroflexota bacterium]